MIASRQPDLDRTVQGWGHDRLIDQAVQRCLAAATEVGRPMFASTLIIGLAFIPLFSMTGPLLFMHVPVAGNFLHSTVMNLLWFAQACLVGGSLRRHASDFGYA